MRLPGSLMGSFTCHSGQSELIQNIAVFVRRSGGYRKSKEVEVSKNLQDCVNIAAQWFRGRVCLILIDDVWCRKGIDSTVTEVLAGLSTETESRIAFTTRDVTLRSTVKIRFGKRERSDAEKMLLHSAWLSTAPKQQKEVSAMEAVLNMAHGLPIALNVIGSRAKYMVGEGGVDSNRVWSTVLDDYKESEQLLTGLAFHNEKNEKVLTVLLSSLDMIDDETSGHKSRHRFTELCILRKRQRVSFDVVERIWGLSAKETKSQIEVLRRFNIIELSSLHVHGQNKRCVMLHDLFIDLARHLAGAHPRFMENTAKRVLHSYVVDRDEKENGESSVSQGGVTNTSVRKKIVSKAKRIFRSRKHSKRNDALLVPTFHEAWICMEDDGFALRNLFRLLRIACMYAEGIALLSDPRWIGKQMRTNGWKQVDTEFADLLTHLEESGPRSSRTSSNDDEDIETFLRMVRAALSESERHVVDSGEQGMLQTQLFGRLYHYRNYRLVGVFLEKLQASANGTWVQSSGAFPIPIPSSGKVLGIDAVRLVRFGEHSVEIVDFDEKENMFRLRRYFPEDDILTNAVEEWKLASRANECMDSQKLCLSQDGKTLVAGVMHGDVLVQKSSCDEEDSCKDAVEVLNHDDTVASLAMSSDGPRVVTGSDDGKIILWDKSNDKWRASEIGTHHGCVSGVSIANGGMYIASGSADETAVIWERNSDSWTPTVMSREDDFIDEEVVSVAISNCGTVLVTATAVDSVHVWTKIGRGWKEEILDNVQWYNMAVIEIRDDKNLIVCGGLRDVILFERDGDQWTRNVLQGHTFPLTNVGIGTGKL